MVTALHALLVPKKRTQWITSQINPPRLLLGSRSGSHMEPQGKVKIPLQEFGRHGELRPTRHAWKGGSIGAQENFRKIKLSKWVFGPGTWRCASWRISRWKMQRGCEDNLVWSRLPSTLGSVTARVLVPTSTLGPLRILTSRSFAPWAGIGGASVSSGIEARLSVGCGLGGHCSASARGEDTPFSRIVYCGRYCCSMRHSQQR